eukprot:gene16887-20037_t
MHGAAFRAPNLGTPEPFSAPAALALRPWADQAFLGGAGDEDAGLGVDRAAVEAPRAAGGRAVLHIEVPVAGEAWPMEPQDVVKARHLHAGHPADPVRPR